MKANSHRILLDAVNREFQKRECEESLYAFVKRYWHVVEPGAVFVDNWHIEAICLHLEAVTRRDIKRLVINVPFRTAKSTITSVLWPAWVWLKQPEHQWLTGSYAEKLAIRDSLKTRRLITSPLYRRDYGYIYDLAGDQNEKRRYENTKNGYRIAFGMTGGVMGDGANTVLLDDPHDRRGAHSETERPDTLTTYDEAVVTRLNKPAEDAIVIIMQRLHHLDLSGHVLKDKLSNWTHLMIPMEFEASRRCVTSIGWRDPRTKEGELMFPARFPKATVDSLKVTLGDQATAGQLQQRPSPDGGGILQTGHFQLWPAKRPLPQLAFVLQSYDTAFTEKTENDPTACTVWGVFGQSIGGELVRCALLLDAWDEHLPYPKIRPKIIDDWNQLYGGEKNDPTNPPRKPDALLMEEKGSGISLIQDLRQARIPVIPYNPGRASKVSRAHLAAPLLETDVFYVLESNAKDKDGKPQAVKWARTFMEQLEAFPNGEHDDYVDTFTQAVIYLQRTEQLELPKAPDDEVEETDYHEKRLQSVNPYGN